MPGPPGIHNTPNLPAPVFSLGILGPFFIRGVGVVSWSRRFDEPIELPDGRKLKTLAEAIGVAGERDSVVGA